MKQQALINIPVADLRREPKEWQSSSAKDLLQETQLLFGEKVLLLEERGEWSFIEASEQPRCINQNQWKGYQGWIKSESMTFLEEDSKGNREEQRPSNLVVDSLWAVIYEKPTVESRPLMQVSFGTYLTAIDSENDWCILRLPDGRQGMISMMSVSHLASQVDIRHNLLKLGKKFLGFPYFWGGRSAFQAEWEAGRSSVDCSGLVNLLFRAHGMIVPRDAHDQYLKSIKRHSHDLCAGDLVFLSNVDNRERMNHVMIYAGEGYLLEATALSGNVRMVSVEERFGCSLLKMPWGGHNEKHYFYYGSLLSLEDAG